jgi:hypothetical protein
MERVLCALCFSDKRRGTFTIDLAGFSFRSDSVASIDADLGIWFESRPEMKEPNQSLQPTAPSRRG